MPNSYELSLLKQVLSVLELLEAAIDMLQGDRSLAIMYPPVVFAFRKAVQELSSDFGSRWLMALDVVEERHLSSPLPEQVHSAPPECTTIRP